MRTHTNNFKIEIAKYGKQIDTKLYHYFNYNLISESNDTIITENNLSLISEQINTSDKELISKNLLWSMSIVKNGQLLQSLMKEFDFDGKVELKVGEVVNPQLGVLVNNAYEYLDYGKYIIYSKEYIAESEMWHYVCFDKMLYAMLPYKAVNVTYPCTIRNYINAVANRIGLTFADISNTFTNYDQLIYKDVFENQNVTYRDVLDKLSEITASNILINDNDELELGYPNETNDTIDETNLKDVNVTFGEKFGEITKVAIIDTEGNYQYVKGTDGTQITIKDNILAFNGDTDTICQNILDNLNGLYYYICDFKTTGVCYYDYLDLFNVSANGNTYKCLLLNNEINITSGIDESIYNDKPKESETETNNYTTSIMTNKQVQFKINRQEGKLESKVEKNGVISAINQSAEEIKIQANKIKLEGYTTINDGFKVDLEGNMEATSGTIGGWIIKPEGLTNGVVKVNSDGSSTLYTVADLIIIRNYILGTPGFTNFSTALINHYDLNNDGQITALDYTLLQNLIGIPMD